MHSWSDSFISPALIISYPDLNLFDAKKWDLSSLLAWEIWVSKLNVVEMEIFKYTQNALFSSIGLWENHF